MPNRRSASLPAVLLALVAACQPLAASSTEPPSSLMPSPSIPTQPPASMPVVTAVPSVAATQASESPSSTPVFKLGAAFTRTDDLTPPRWWHTATRLLDGRVLVTGGQLVDPASKVAPPTLARVDIFDPTTGHWTSGPSLLHRRQLHTATLLPDGRVLVLGGSAETTGGGRADPVPGGELFDPARSRWTPTADPPAAVLANPVVVADGSVLVAGTDLSHPGRTVAERYDPTTDRWTLLSEPPAIPAWASATVLADGRVLFAGGTDSTSELPSAEPTTVVFNPADGTWRTGQDMPEGVFGHTATLLEDGRVVVAGSGTDLGVGVTFVFYPESLTWTIGRTPILARIGGTAVRLADGRVFVAGNGFCDGSDSVAEVFDPDTGNWSSAGSVPVIDGGTSTILADGRVLLAGGQAPCSEATFEGNAFLFDPGVLN